MDQIKLEQAYTAFNKTVKFNDERRNSNGTVLFGEYSDMYTFTTENINGYLRAMDVNGKKVLTVTASGDHLINLALKGAKEIDCFDINRNSYYITELKIAALKALSYKEFLAFFATHISYEAYAAVPAVPNMYCFSRQIYMKIRPFLPPDVAFYFEALFSKYEDLASENIFYSSSIQDIVLFNAYLQDEESYNKARMNIGNIKYSYTFCDVYEIYKLGKQYDLILLSNIYDYLIDTSKPNFESKYINYVMNELKKMLNDGGSIAVTYQYFYRRISLFLASLDPTLKNNYVIKKRPELDKYSFSKVIVPGAKSYKLEQADDCVYVYKKK